MTLAARSGTQKEGPMAKKKKTYTQKLMKARSAGMLRQTKAGSWDRKPSKKKRSKLHCRNKDPRKGGFSS